MNARSPGDIPWWKRTTVYQIYPRSFADANGDGIGDLPGVLAKLDYLQGLGVETLWLSPFYDSPQADFGYDIRDHFRIAKELGTAEDARRLIDEIHARGMKIVFDMVLNHTSDQHPWFLASRSSRTDPKRDWYIWRDGRGRDGKKPPNNWRSMVGGSGWTYDEATGQWFWATFLPFQPDLNYRNPAVKQAMLDVVRHWLGAGVDGLRLDIFNAIYKDPSFADNPFSFRPLPSEDDPDGFFQRNVHTIDHPDTLAFARELRAVVDEFSEPPRFLVGEVFGPPSTLRRYCGEDGKGLHLVFLFKAMRTAFRGAAVRAFLEEVEAAFPEPFTPTYVLGNHDRPRLLHRLRGDVGKARLLATLQLTARGVPFVYYGEEIGMDHYEIPLLEAQDPLAARHRRVPPWLARWLGRRGVLLNRDECRTPMQWSGEAHGGFAPKSARPWLAAHPDAGRVNVAQQEKDPTSLLHCYRGLLGLRRRSAALNGGSLELVETSLPPDVVAYRRVWEDARGRQEVHVLLNFGAHPVTLSLEPYAGDTCFSTRHGQAPRSRGPYALAPREGLVVYREADLARPSPSSRGAG